MSANYRRLISYIYAYEGGVKGRNVGFAKLETRNGQCRIQVSVRKIYVGSQDTGVYLLAGDKEILLGRIFLRNGAGEFRASVQVDNVAGSNQTMDRCYGLTLHSMEDSWQSYTTIWEDAVAHAAEVELSEAVSELMEEKVMQQVPESCIREESADAGISVSERMQAAEVAASPNTPTIEEWQREMDVTAKRQRQADMTVKPQPELDAMKELQPELDAMKEPQPEQEVLKEPQPEQEVLKEPQPEQEVLKEPQPEQNVLKEPQMRDDVVEEQQMNVGTTEEYLEKQDMREERTLSNVKSETTETITQSLQQDWEQSQRDQLEMLGAKEPVEDVEVAKLWNYFVRTYPKIQPFDYNGGCEILTIKPQDIGLLPREIWTYGNNSFLLHGYYNHRHLILVRLSHQDQPPRFLLGVPGHYFSNEKYMAAMFGFPNFVLSKMQPSGDGRFGYWYTDIRLGNQ